MQGISIMKHNIGEISSGKFSELNGLNHEKLFFEYFLKFMKVCKQTYFLDLFFLMTFFFFFCFLFFLTESKDDPEYFPDEYSADSNTSTDSACFCCTNADSLSDDDELDCDFTLKDWKKYPDDEQI